MDFSALLSQYQAALNNYQQQANQVIANVSSYDPSAATALQQELNTNISNAQNELTTNFNQYANAMNEYNSNLGNQTSNYTNPFANVTQQPTQPSNTSQATQPTSIEEFKAQAEKEITNAKAQAEKEVSDAKAQVEKQVSDAKAQAEKQVSDAKAQADSQTSTASTKTTTGDVVAGVTGGVAGDIGLMSLNNSTIDDIVGRINACVEEIEAEWTAIVNNEIAKINSSWAATEAKSYVDKTMNAGNKIKSVEDGLKLLASTYSKVNVDSSATQQDVNRMVNNI